MEDDQHKKIELKLINASVEPTVCNSLTAIPLEKHSFHIDESTVLESLHVLYNIPYS